MKVAEAASWIVLALRGSTEPTRKRCSSVPEASPATPSRASSKPPTVSAPCISSPTAKTTPSTPIAEPIHWRRLSRSSKKSEPPMATSTGLVPASSATRPAGTPASSAV
jgi:hypothetical protein